MNLSCSFFLVFGLACEVLSALSDSNTDYQQTAETALQILQYLVQVKFSGYLFQDFAIFEELVNLFYRVASMEHASVQVQLLHTLASLCKTFGEIPSFKSTAICQMHCFRLCGYIIRKLTSNPWNSLLYANCTLAGKAVIINTAFDAYNDMSECCQHIPEVQSKTLGLTLYFELLQDEHANGDLVGPTLQSLKRLLEYTNSSSTEKYDQVFHGMLSACLNNIDKMRGRKGPSCSQKVKCNMLAIALILSNSSTVKLGLSIIDSYCCLISQKLLELQDIAITAAQCGRTLIASAVMGNNALHSAIRLLLPTLTQVVFKIVSTQDQEDAAQFHAIITEIWKSFAFILMHFKDQATEVLLLFLPTMILVLQSSLTGLHSTTVTQIVHLASVFPAEFKDVTATLEEEERGILEGAVKQAIGGGKQNINEVTKPQILLKSF